jgi:hypothetical protein
MDQGLSNTLKLIFLSVLLASCQKHPEDHLIYLLKNNYANLYVNDPLHKKEVIAKLEAFLKAHPLNQHNEKDISLLLNQLNDGHVLLKNNTVESRELHADLEFLPGTMLVSRCEKSCTPAIKAGKYEITNINGFTFEDWLQDNSKYVYASTPRGGRYRASRLLLSDKVSNAFSLTLQDKRGVKFQTYLKPNLEAAKNEKCVEGLRVDKTNYYIRIKTFWCDKNNDRYENLIGNYKNDWNAAIKDIQASDKILIDLRENYGGDDIEVNYSMNTFIGGTYPLYRSRYLTVNAPGKIKKLIHRLPLKFKLWSDVATDYSETKSRPSKNLFANKVNVLISNGCFSSCEGMAAAFKNLKRAKLFGTTTHGGAGDPRFFKLNGADYSINLPTGLSYQTNGQLIEGKGIMPDIEILDSLSIPGDAALERALKD